MIAVFASCGDDDGSARDASAPDGFVPDTGPELDASEPDARETGPTDSGPEELPDVVIECPPPPAGPAPPAGRWSLSLFHYNVQYVAGGTVGFAEIALGNPRQARLFDHSEEVVEDRIVTESLVPVLEILERNPDMALTFEMQGYMVDVMRERHPDTIERMRALVESEQLELASIHWSDQMFLTWGRADMDESERRTRESFAAADLPLSRVVFAQEGQFGEGFAAWLAEKRPDAIAVMARNLQGFYQSDLVERASWRVRGTDVVLPRGLTDETVDRSFSFFDDGELLATADANPYLGPAFARVESAVRTYEAELRCAIDRGYRVGRITDYLAAVEATGFEPMELPPFLDGTWQPGSTRGPLRWHGGRGDLWAKHERDNDVITLCAEARQLVLALDGIAAAAGPMASMALRDARDLAWRELLLGQVSDARGVNPWHGEMVYGRTHCSAAATAAFEGIDAEAEANDAAGVEVDVRSGVVRWLASVPSPAPPMEVAAPAGIDVTISEGAERAPEVRWLEPAGRSPSDPPLHRVEIEWPAVDAAVDALASCVADGGTAQTCAVVPPPIAVRFPRRTGSIGYRPALLGDVVQYSDDDFSFDGRAMTEGVWTVVGDGFVDLGNGWFLVKDTLEVGLAVGFTPGTDYVEIRDETQTDTEATRWAFWLTQDETTALELAERNLAPVVVVDRERPFAPPPSP
ncbi:MAG: hypothetical protein IT379_20115 [Deltaproteobacteria bacterium]|nr:hypothetical protein [Deltaproteobacteria bacterium]